MTVQGIITFTWLTGYDSGDYGTVDTRTVRIGQSDVIAQASLAATDGGGAHRVGIAAYSNVALGGGQTFPNWQNWPVSYYIQACTSVTFGFVNPGHGSVGILGNIFVL
jgi:hypothetical protein